CFRIEYPRAYPSDRPPPLAGPIGLAAEEHRLEWTILGLRHRIKRSLKSVELQLTARWKKRRGCWERVFPTKIVSLKVRVLLINSFLQGFAQAESLSARSLFQ